MSETRQIGPYKLLELLGEGGMGEVWLAEQLEPVRRQVALKIIKLGMDTKQVVARFEAERQALAVMDHPQHRQGVRRRCHARGPSCFSTCSGCFGAPLSTRLASGDLAVSAAVGAWSAPYQAYRRRSALERHLGDLAGVIGGVLFQNPADR